MLAGAGRTEQHARLTGGAQPGETAKRHAPGRIPRSGGVDHAQPRRLGQVVIVAAREKHRPGDAPDHRLIQRQQSRLRRRLAASRGADQPPLPARRLTRRSPLSSGMLRPYGASLTIRTAAHDAAGGGPKMRASATRSQQFCAGCATSAPPRSTASDRRRPRRYRRPVLALVLFAPTVTVRVDAPASGLALLVLAGAGLVAARLIRRRPAGAAARRATHPGWRTRTADSDALPAHAEETSPRRLGGGHATADLPLTPGR